MSERVRVGLRVLVVFGAYFAYRDIGDRELLAGLVVALGLVALGFVVIDRVTVARTGSLGRLRLGVAAAGVVLVAAGTYLAVR